jgi:hypothetical protein
VARRLLLLLVLVALVAACGRVKAVTPNHFTRDATKDCLEDEQQLEVSTADDDVGFIGATATGGALRTEVNGKGVVIVFGDDPTDAAAIANAFRQVATPQQRKRLPSLLEPRGNAVIDWISEPSRDDAELVRDCLK